MSFSGDLVQQSRSMEFFMRPDSYGPFWLNRHGQRPVGCIDPRDENRSDLHIILQTAGGAAGKAYDQAVALAAYEDGSVDLCSGIVTDSRLQRATIATGHHACAFMNGLSKVNTEIAHPSDMTLDTLSRLVARYELDDVGFRQNVLKIQDTAERNQETFNDTNPTELLKKIEEAYPSHEVVNGMVGDNKAGIYIFNHHPFLGLRRDKVHRGENPLEVQAYHDSVSASVGSLRATEGLHDLKGLRLAALVMRIAATPTVLIGADKRIHILHVVPTHAGYQVEQQPR